MVFQMLFANETTLGEEGEIVSMMMHELKVTKKKAGEASSRVKAVIDALPQIDERISKHSTEYSFNRISLIEKNILRLSIYELFYDTQIPWKVSIAEAIRLCRKFGTPESAHFINAVLDAICKEEKLCLLTSESSVKNP